MKKCSVIAALMLVFAMVLSGCADNTPKPAAPAGNSASQETTPAKPDEPAKPADDQPAEPAKPAFNQEDCLDKIPFSVNMPACWEFRDVDVNGEFRRISVQFEVDKADLSLDKPFSYYYIDIHGDGSTSMKSKTVTVGRFLLGEYAAEELRENKDNDEFLGMEDFFWTDFKASAFKGQDQEYIVFKIPASWEFNTASMIITAPDATLLAEVVVD